MSAPPPPPPPPPPRAAAAAAGVVPSCPHFRVLEGDGGVEVPEAGGNALHLGPVLRRYTSARLAVRASGRTTTVELPLLYDALGLLRALQHDVASFNAACSAGGGAAQPPSSATRYACYRLTRQAAAFGARVPRPGTGTVEVPGLDELVAWVEAAHATQLAAAAALLAGGVVDFASLGELFRPGTDLLDRGAATGLFGVPTAFRARGGYYSRGKSLFGVVSTYFAALECVVAVDGRFAVVEATVPMPEFQGTRSVRDGLEGFVLLTEQLRVELARRGQLYVRTAGAAEGALMQYDPGCFLPSPRAGVGRGVARARGGGRCMVDSRAAWARGVHCARAEGSASDAVRGVMKLMAQRARMAAAPSSAQHSAGADGQAAAAEEEESLELLVLSAPLPDNLLWLTWPVAAGFSFDAKSWGVVMVAGLRPVTFNEEAFARLVLPPARKQLIQALVRSHGGGSHGGLDIIAGKGEGTIFLLHGPPGCGKTLTAEAIAELLHRPLYVVSMGELGTTPEALEERLTDVLEVCTPWGALVLIDEAEMLLERRTKNDLVRNAMVCVMLRLLEYYTGILFLTTNRVESLDPAFQSRVQCALRYEPLDAASRARIWADLLARLQVPRADDVDVEALAVRQLNGRQIKNTLQLALALAVSEGSHLAQRHLEATLDITTAFVEHAAAPGE